MTSTATAAGSAGYPASDDVPVFSMLGVRVGAYDVPHLNARLIDAIEGNEQIVVANHNLHSLYLHERDPKLRAFHAGAEVTHADGMSVVFLGRLLGVPLARRHRVTYVDWLGPLMAEAVRHGWRVFAVAGRPGVFERAAKELRTRHPGLELEGTHGYFDPTPGSAENRDVLRRVATFRPHVLLVGMGMPRQEHWVYDNRAQIVANVILMAGAALDYVAGVVPTPPRGAGRFGLEWLWRLASEPARLWRRYLVEPWFVFWRVLVEWARRRLGGNR